MESRQSVDRNGVSHSRHYRGCLHLSEYPDRGSRRKMLGLSKQPS